MTLSRSLPHFMGMGDKQSHSNDSLPIELFLLVANAFADVQVELGS